MTIATWRFVISLYFRAYLLLVLFRWSNAASCKHNVGLSGLKELVTGRCQDYQTKVNPEAFCVTGLQNCTGLWERFSSPFLHQDPCNASHDAFDSFIATANVNVSGKMLFWSGTNYIAHQYSNMGQRYTTLEDTLIGYMIDGLSFCGDVNTTDGFGESCPWQNADSCPSPHWNSFWTAASINFAHHASGEIFVLLNATRSPIYKTPSYFHDVEVPNINSSRVTKLTIVLLNASPSLVRSPCTADESVRLLKHQLQPIHVDCIENPSDLVHVYCADNPSFEVCLTGSGSSGATVPRPWSRISKTTTNPVPTTEKKPSLPAMPAPIG